MAEQILVGKVSGVFGIKGWVKVFSYTQPRERIFGYSPWLLANNGELTSTKVLETRQQGKSLVARLQGIETREQAEALIGAEIKIERNQLPPLEPGEYYWQDLIGLTVENLADQCLGRIAEMMETGANDVMIVRDENREILIPWIRDQVVKQVDLEAGKVQVDWDPDF